MDSPSAADRHWSRIHEVGTLWGLQMLRLFHDWFGRRTLSALLSPIALYFVLFKPSIRKCSLAYLEIHAKQYPSRWQSKPGISACFKHCYSFAQSIVDKLMSWCTDIEPSRFQLASPEKVEQLMDDTRGQLIIGSHFGNLEFCRGFMQRYKNKTINVLAHDKHSINYNTVMQELNPDSRLNIFQVEDFDVTTMLMLKQKIDAGEWVFIAGDRVPLSGETHTVEVDFFGRSARFPTGPYMLAKGLGCPVKLMFSYCDYFSSAKPVHFELIEFSDRIKLDRGNRQASLKALAQQFASELEKQCSIAPFHWFNFYDFWQTLPPKK